MTDKSHGTRFSQPGYHLFLVAEKNEYFFTLRLQTK